MEIKKKYIENIFLAHCKVIYVLLQQKLNFVFEVVFISDMEFIIRNIMKTSYLYGCEAFDLVFSLNIS